MSSVENVIIDYLDKSREMQIATCAGDRPWICSVYDQPIRGVQFEGMAEEITDPKEIALHIAAYEQRYNRPGLGRDIIGGVNPHHLYRITPSRFLLIDKGNFPDVDIPQEWLPNA